MFDIIILGDFMKDILHCDLNSFFASVECLKRPELKNVPMAVCGDPKIRHGIILAKNEIAKKYDIKTAETIYQAQKKCPDLVLVQGMHSDYVKYSKLVNNIYIKYTDRVEPCSIDESYLDVTESKSLFGSAYDIAYKIKEEVKNTLGLTISVGVSYNRVLAKMGSDFKKPDAITVFNKNNFKKFLWGRPVSELMLVGKSTYRVLNQMRIYTIGDLANYDVVKLTKKLGKLGNTIYNYANGVDSDVVSIYEEKFEPKSVSKGITLKEDTDDIEFLVGVIKMLSGYIANSLRKKKLRCSVVSIIYKDEYFAITNRQKQIGKTDLYQDISKAAILLLKENYTKNVKIRTITVAVSNLVSDNDEVQLFMFDEAYVDSKNEKIEKATLALDDIIEKYGDDKINFASILKNNNKKDR